MSINYFSCFSIIEHFLLDFDITRVMESARAVHSVIVEIFDMAWIFTINRQHDCKRDNANTSLIGISHY